MISLNYLKYILHFINMLLVVVLSLVMLLTPNITIYVFTKESNNGIFIVVFLLIIFSISLIPLKKDFKVLNLCSIISIIILTITIIYSIYQLIQWFYITTEGILHLRFITVIKTASLEIKLQQYNNTLLECLAKLGQQSNEAENYLKGLHYIMNPSSIEIQKTSLQDITSLVNSNLTKGLADYERYLQLNIPSTNNNKKIILTIIGVTLIVGIAYYFGQASLAEFMRKWGKDFALNSQKGALITSETTSTVSQSLLDIADLSKVMLNLTITLGVLQDKLDVLEANSLIDTNNMYENLKIIHKSFRFLTHIGIPYPALMLPLLFKPENAELGDYLGRLSHSTSKQR